MGDELIQEVAIEVAVRERNIQMMGRLRPRNNPTTIVITHLANGDVLEAYRAMRKDKPKEAYALDYLLRP